MTLDGLPHQVEGLNWLLFSWYTRRNVLLADEMGLGKTAQALAFLDHLRMHEHVRGPFLVVARCCMQALTTARRLPSPHRCAALSWSWRRSRRSHTGR